MLQPGAPAPDLALDAAPVVLVFFKIACPTCQYAFPYLERLHRAGARLLAISQDDPEGTSQFHAEFGVTIPTIFDREEDGYPASNAYGITHVPSLFQIEHGKITWTTSGFSKSDLTELARRLSAPLFLDTDQVPMWKPG